MGLKVQFGGTQCNPGNYIIIESWYTPHVAGNPGSRVVLQNVRGRIFTIPLSQVREHAEIEDDGSDELFRIDYGTWLEQKHSQEHN